MLLGIYGGFPKMVVPQQPWAFLLKRFGGYHHLRKHPYDVGNSSAKMRVKILRLTTQTLKKERNIDILFHFSSTFNMDTVVQLHIIRKYQHAPRTYARRDWMEGLQGRVYSKSKMLRMNRSH